MLKIINQIKTNGLKKTIQKYSLEHREFGHRLYLRYDQLKTPKNLIETHDCRGLVLHKETLEIISMPFRRFFGHDDFYSPKLNWSNTVVMEKRDGSLIQVYYDKFVDEWVVATMLSEGTDLFSYKGEKTDISFRSLFLDLMKQYGSSFDLFKKGCTYVFELTSPYNKVVVGYQTPELRLIGFRDLTDLREANFESLKYHSSQIKIPLVETFTFTSLKECLDTFKSMSFNFEGYVAYDGISRIKIKNPAYVSVHLASSSNGDIDVSKPHILLDVIKGNEIDEFLSAFPQTTELVTNLDTKYRLLLSKLAEASTKIKPPKNITKTEQKLYASSVFNTLADYGLDATFSSGFFLLKDQRITEISDYVRGMDNEHLYKILRKLN